MNTNALWNEAIKTASPEEITRFAQIAPKTLTNASTPDQDDGLRDKGLLLTKKQVIDLRKYEAAALALPFTLADVRAYLNFGDDSGGGAGLNHQDFLMTFSATRRHAQRWSPLRESIMLTGSQLKIFAANMSLYGRDMEEVYSDVKASNLLEKHDIKTLEQLKKLELEMGSKFPGIQLESDTVSDLGYYLDQIFKKVNENLKNVEAIKTTLAAFGYDLREQVLPNIKLRVNLIGSNSLPAKIETLNQQITERGLRIEEKNAEYKAAVEKSIGAAAGLNMVGLALAIYLGVEADKIRVERNRLYKEQEEAIETLQNKNQTLGSLNRVKHDLQGLELVAVDADIATQNLMHVWNVMHSYVKQSQDAVAGIHDALTLRRFMTEFRQVVFPWTQIATDADALIAVFREADAEYERNYGLQPRVAALRNIQSGYPNVDLNTLAESDTLMREGAVQSRALFIKWNYLPHLHDRFNDLMSSVSASSGVLSGSALETKMSLEHLIRRLEGLEKELDDAVDAGDQQDIEEILAECAGLLTEAGKVVARPTRQLNNQLSAINGIFDRRLTLGFIDDLEKDQLLAKAVVDQLQGDRAEHQQARGVITEAINALTQGGIETIGKGLALTLEEVTKLGIAPPQVALVMFAIEQLKKTIGQVGEGIRFLDLVRERDKLVEKIKRLDRETEMKKDEITSLKGKAEFIHTVHAMDDQRQRYFGEYQHAVRAFQLFATQVEVGKQIEDGEHAVNLIDQARQFIVFLSPLASPLRPNRQ